MHAGEVETSILLHAAPDLVREGYEAVDHDSDWREFLLTLGLKAHSESGVLGFPSYATAEKGKGVLESLTASFAKHLEVLGESAG